MGNCWLVRRGSVDWHHLNFALKSADVGLKNNTRITFHWRVICWAIQSVPGGDLADFSASDHWMKFWNNEWLAWDRLMVTHRRTNGLTAAGWVTAKRFLVLIVGFRFGWVINKQPGVHLTCCHTLLHLQMHMKNTKRLCQESNRRWVANQLLGGFFFSLSWWCNSFLR